MITSYGKIIITSFHLWPTAVIIGYRNTSWLYRITAFMWE